MGSGGFLPFNDVQLSAWFERLVESFEDVTWQTQSSVFLRTTRDKIEISKFFYGDLADREGHIHEVSFSSGLTILGFPFELSHHWSRRLLASKQSRVWALGCIDDVAGYLPTRWQRILGGYEGRDFLIPFNVHNFQPGYHRELQKVSIAIMKKVS